MTLLPRFPTRTRMFGQVFAGVLGLSGLGGAVMAQEQLHLASQAPVPLQSALGAQVTAYKQAIAEASFGAESLAAYYRDQGYVPIWTGKDDLSRARRAALLDALRGVTVHGLPAERYDVDGLLAQMADVRSTRDLGAVEVALSRIFVQYASDLNTGILTPAKVDKEIKREVPVRSAQTYLDEFAVAEPQSYLRHLPPNTAEYRALMKEKLRLERLVAAGGWGPKVQASKLEPGQSGQAVVALRNRLMAMGYLQRSATRSYDAALEKAVQQFQLGHGLEADGVAGSGTLKELNVPARDRLKSVIVAMERERWLNHERGDRHILVNQTDFTARVVDHGQVTFETRSVIGKDTSDRRTPEFSDVMEHMVINPSWYVPRSIITKEYLPKLRANPNAVGHLEITDSRGRKVSRNHNFAQYSARSFPFAMRQPPGKKNALGLVKFMFPNKYNIYLHDTPQKHLFSREVRAYSHGCIRLAQPFEFAYALLALQSDDPKGEFHRILDSGRETKVVLERPVPVHLIYRTAFTNTEGQTEYRRDIYGRDARIWDALSRAGVALADVQG